MRLVVLSPSREMPVNLKLVTGGLEGRSLTSTNVINAPYATTIALRGALPRLLKDTLKSIYSIARGAASAPKSARKTQ